MTLQRQPDFDSYVQDKNLLSSMVSPKTNKNNISNMTQENKYLGHSVEYNNTSNRDDSAPKNLKPYKQYMNFSSRNNSDPPNKYPKSPTLTPKGKEQQNYIDESLGHGIKNQKL